MFDVYVIYLCIPKIRKWEILEEKKRKFEPMHQNVIFCVRATNLM